jgi:hypothetical protein
MNEMSRIDWVDYHHEDMVTLFNFDVVSIKIKVIVKGQTFVLPSPVSLMFT